MNPKLNRALHRDLGYLFLGLIISFSFSGILMNHRQVWQPDKYSVETRGIRVAPLNQDQINDKIAEKLGSHLGIEDEFRRYKIKDGMLKLSYVKHDVEIDLKTGNGEITRYEKTPIVGHMIKLHKSTSNWWIYYSDLFGISLILISITGAIMMPSKSRFSFRNRGWKLGLVGLIVPLLLLIFA